MTVCVYKDGVLASDALVTTGTLSHLTPYKKIGMIYKSVVNGERSLSCDPNTLQDPSEFAMYALSGELRSYSKFLRWFINHPISGYDHEDYLLGLEDIPESQENVSALIIFKDKPICRTYDSDYLKDLFIEYPREGSVICIGAGSKIAEGILSYDPSANIKDVIEAVSRVDTTCGNGVLSLSFS